MPFLLACLLLVLFRIGPASAQDEPVSPYLKPTREILGHMRDQRTAAETALYQQQILAWSDSLEAVDELVLATQCLERAGLLDYYAGEFAAAIEIWDHGLEVARRSEDPKRIGALLNAQATGVSATGDNVGAIHLYRDLIEFRSRNDDLRGVGIALSNLAFSQVALFQYPEAIVTVREAVAIHREVANRAGLAHAQLTLSELLAHAGKHEEAAALADSAVANARIVGAAQQLAPSLHARALRKVAAGDNEAAIIDFDECVELLESNGLLTMLGATIVNRADALVSLGRAEEAVVAVREALPNVDGGMNPAQSVAARGTLGRAMLRAGQRDEARRVLEEGIDLLFALQDSLADAVQRADANVVAIPLSVLPILELEEHRAEAAWRVVESGLARQLRRAVRDGDDIVSLEQFQALLAGLDARALVIGVTSAEGCPVLLVEADRVSGARLGLDASMSTDLARITDLVAGGSDRTILQAPLQRISNRWSEALTDLFASERRRLIVMPGGLGGFPFELLPSPGGEILGDLYDLSYAPSATVLVELESRRSKTQMFLAFANPVAAPQDLEPTNALSMRATGESRLPLPEAREEVRRISPGGGRVLVGEAATASALLNDGGGVSVLHLAVHASVDTQDPHASALLMAPDAEHVHGILAVDTIAAADIPADLVSLSGCSTVGGYQVLGEGTFGLVRAFFEAGTRSVVASRWDVEDAAARRFMELFYEGLARGEARDSALGAARRTMRDEGYGYRDRAAFALVGAVSGQLPVLMLAGGRGVNRSVFVVLPVVVIIAILAARRRRST